VERIFWALPRFGVLVTFVWLDGTADLGWVSSLLSALAGLDAELVIGAAAALGLDRVRVPALATLAAFGVRGEFKRLFAG
jgi:hypothetical protein